MVKSLVLRGLNAFVSKQTNIFSAALFIILTTILSQILGIAKYRLLVTFFGVSSDLGVYFAAFKIPDFLFQVVIAGALSSSFIPIFSEFVSGDRKREGYAFASTIIQISLVVYLFLSLGIFIFAYQLAGLIAPDFSEPQLQLMANIMRIIQLAQVFFVVGTVITAILQAFQHFLIPGIASACYNLGIIIGVLLFAKEFGIYGATIGVLIGAILFCVVQFPTLFMTGFRFVRAFEITNSVKKLMYLMVPRTLTLVTNQAAILASTFFALLISERSIIVFDLAQTLMLAPVLLFGQSIAQASFPALSLKRDNKEEFSAIFISSFNQILYLTLPISAILMVLRIPIVRLFFGADRFDWEATVSTGMTLSMFAISIGAQSLIYLFSRVFYSVKDAKTPFVITLASVLLYITLSYLFVIVYDLEVYSLALAFSISSIVSVLLLAFFAHKLMILPKFYMFISIGKILVATFMMGLALYIPIKLLDQLVIDTTRTIGLIILTGIAGGLGFIAYLFFTWLLDIQEAYYVLAVIKKFGNRNKVLKQITEVIGDTPNQNP